MVEGFIRKSMEGYHGGVHWKDRYCIVLEDILQHSNGVGGGYGESYYCLQHSLGPFVADTA